MENYKSRLQDQAKALQADIDLMIKEIEKVELDLENKKDAKSVAFRELKSIEKKLAKL